jgi:excinuclease ABC subunit C
LEADALAVRQEAGVFCVSKIMIRAGRVLGGRTFFPRTAPNTEAAEVLSAFMAQHYFAQGAPREIIVNCQIEDIELFQQAFAEQSDHAVSIRMNVRALRRKWLEMATTNAEQALISHRASNANLRRQYQSLTDLLGLDETPGRIECFDISHSAGDKTVASCVVFGLEGAAKSAYRRFNINTAAAGDDYGAIAEVIQRRYLRTKRGEAPLPDLIMIDGGRGQLGAAKKALEELQMADLPMIGVAKGTGRKPGREKVYRGADARRIEVPANSPAMRLIQQIRDEAHRFAITGHRQRLGGARKKSTLESIAGLGPARRKALLNHFGGLQGVRKAGVDDLSRVTGISRRLAERIFAEFHDGINT